MISTGRSRNAKQMLCYSIVGEGEETCGFLLRPLQRRRQQDSLLYWFHHFWNADGMLYFLLPSAKIIRTWQGKRTSVGERTTKEKCGPKPKLSLPDQFFMVLVRLRLGRVVEDLADCFYVSPPTVSRTFTTWTNLMYFKFQELLMWMSRRKVDQHIPPSFRQWYPTTRVIIDATEFFIEKPSSVARQSATWSSYKNHNTFKSLLAISPDGIFTFRSPGTRAQ